MNNFIDKQKLKMKEYDAKYLQAINLQNEFQCFKIDYSHLLDDDEKKFLEYKINKLNREQENIKIMPMT